MPISTSIRMPNSEEFKREQPHHHFAADDSGWTRVNDMSWSAYNIHVHTNTLIALKFYMEQNLWTNWLWSFRVVASPKVSSIHTVYYSQDDIVDYFKRLISHREESIVSCRGVVFDDLNSDHVAPRGVQCIISISWKFPKEPQTWTKGGIANEKSLTNSEK